MRMFKRLQSMAALFLCLFLTVTSTVCVRAEENSPKAATQAEVQPASKKEQKLSFTKSAKKLTTGKSYQFRVNTSSKVTWSVGDKKIATVSKSGLVKAKRYGKTKIYASKGKQKISVTLQVKGKKIIGIDPGHQSRGDSHKEPNGPGSSTYKAKVAGGTSGKATGKAEYQLTLEVARKLEKELWDRGYQVVLTRDKNKVNISNKKRAEIINKSGADICIRLHADGAGSSARGATVLCPSSSNRYVGKLHKNSKKLSKALISAYCKKTGIRNRGISYRDDLTGTNWSTVPVALLEMGFMTNATEDRYMSSADGQKDMVQGMANGIDAYFGYK